MLNYFLCAFFFVPLQEIRCVITAFIMGKKKRKAGRRISLQAVTLCISTAMVLILLGMVVFSVLTAQNLSAYVKENLTLTMVLDENVTNPEVKQLLRELSNLPYVNKVTYISKEQVLKEQTQAMGTDPSEFIGVNPFVGSMELQFKAQYANNDSLKWISKQLKTNNKVTDITYPQDLVESVNSKLQRINIVLLVLACLLLFVSFSLINNTVRLGMYARRFTIHTMKLVGASWGFIRAPFVRNAVAMGFLASLLAEGVLAGGLYELYLYEPDILAVLTIENILIMGGAVLLFGLLITLVCSWLSVNKYLRMKAGDLYKI